MCSLIFLPFQFYHLLSLGKKEKENLKKTTLNTSCQIKKIKIRIKKIGKENKTKTKVQSIGKRNALVLRTFKFEKTDDRDLKEAHNPLSASG